MRDWIWRRGENLKKDGRMEGNMMGDGVRDESNVEIESIKKKWEMEWNRRDGMGRDWICVNVLDDDRICVMV